MNKILKETVKLAYRNSRNHEVLTLRNYTTSGSGSSSSSSSYSQVSGDVPGLSKNVVNVPTYEVGYPKASKTAEYKNPEYFCYHNMSFFEAEVEMNKYRLPQPSNKIKN